MSELNLVDTELGLRLIYTWCEYSCEVLVSEKHARVRLEWWSPVQVERLSLTLTVRGWSGDGGKWWLDVVYLKQGATPNVWSGLVGLEVLMVKTDK